MPVDEADSERCEQMTNFTSHYSLTIQPFAIQIQIISKLLWDLCKFHQELSSQRAADFKFRFDTEMLVIT